MILNETISLIQKELQLEWRQKHALGGIVLYLVSTIFICYLVFAGIVNEQTWNALFWIIMSFASVNLVLKSFVEENSGRKLYLYTLASPVSVIFSKILINTLVMIVLGILGYILFSLFMGGIVRNPLAWWLVLISGVSGFASILTMVSAIAGQTRNNFTMMAILGFPLILPLLLLIIKASASAINGLTLPQILPGVLVILMLGLLSLTLSYILFPYLWKE
jgi:heme exporter protein B